MIEKLILVDWAAWAGVAAAVVLVFDRLARITATKKDDAIVDRVHRILSFLAADFTAKSASGNVDQPPEKSSPDNRQQNADGPASQAADTPSRLA